MLGATGRQTRRQKQSLGQQSRGVLLQRPLFGCWCGRESAYQRTTSNITAFVFLDVRAKAGRSSATHLLLLLISHGHQAQELEIEWYRPAQCPRQKGSGRSS